MILLGLIVLGLVLGSFVNALVWRLHEGKDWVRGRSQCTHCGHTLGVGDLVPVLSYLALKGKCRYCKKKIEDTPLAEVVLPVWFALSYLFWPVDFFDPNTNGLFQFVAWLVAGVLLVALLVYDKRWYILPDKMTYPLAGLALATLAVRAGYYGEAGILLDAVIAAGIISGLFYALFQLSRGKWIGGGDVKLGLALGLYAATPLKAFLLLFLATLAGTIIMLPGLIARKVGRGRQIPFGAFLIIALLITVLFGQKILDWYMNLLAV